MNGVLGPSNEEQSSLSLSLSLISARLVYFSPDNGREDERKKKVFHFSQWVSWEEEAKWNEDRQEK